MVNWKKLANNIPHRIQLGRKIYYEIVWVDDFVDGKTLGETRFDTRQIAIKKNLSPKDIVSTYIHEIAHAYSEEYEFPLSETSVLNLEKGLYYLLKRSNIFKEAIYGNKRTARKRKRKTVKRVCESRKETRKSSKQKRSN